MKDELVVQMEDIKRKRLRAERRTVIMGRLAKLKSVITAARSAPPKRTVADEEKPRCRDLAMMPGVRRMIEAPNDVDVTEQTLQAVVDMLPALEERWLRERKAELVQMLREAGVEAQDGVDPLDLAVAVFKCWECNRFFHHPQVLMHECRTGSMLYDKMEYHYTDYYKCVHDACGRKHAWTQSAFCVAPKLERVRALIELCGKDPKVTTPGDMDAAGFKLVCDEPGFEASVMSWRRAVSPTSIVRPVRVLSKSLTPLDLCRYSMCTSATAETSLSPTGEWLPPRTRRQSRRAKRGKGRSRAGPTCGMRTSDAPTVASAGRSSTRMLCPTSWISSEPCFSSSSPISKPSKCYDSCVLRVRLLIVCSLL